MQKFIFPTRLAVIFTLFSFLSLSLMSLINEPEELWLLIKQKGLIAVFGGLIFGGLFGFLGGKSKI
jgi:hypothetical protein